MQERKKLLWQLLDLQGRITKKEEEHEKRDKWFEERRKEAKEKEEEELRAKEEEELRAKEEEELRAKEEEELRKGNSWWKIGGSAALKAFHRHWRRDLV